MIRIRLLVCSIFLSFFSVIHAQTTLQDSLVAHYPFSGNALDVSGNANHGTVFGATLTADRFGTPNEAYHFDGIDDYISYLNQSQFHPDLPVTVTAWVRILGGPVKHPFFFSDWMENQYHGVWILHRVNQTIGIGFGDGGFVGPNSRRSKGGTTPLVAGTWHHVAAVIKGPLDMNIYLDGREDCGSYDGAGGNIAYAGNPGRSGINDDFSQPGPLNYFEGELDDLRLYSRALSRSEIEQLAGVSPMEAVDTVCIGDPIQLAAPAGYQSYSWLNSASLSCATCASPTVTGAIGGPSTLTYQAVLTKASGCVDTFSTTVEVVNCCSEEFTAVILKKTGGICPDDSIGSITLAGSGGTPSYLYAINGGTFGSSSTFTQLFPGSYVFSIQDSAGCELDTTIQIASPPPAILTQTTVTQQTNFGVNDGTATVSASGGNGGPFTYFWSNGATTDSISGLAPGVYTVEVKDAQGCIKMDSVEVLAVRTSIPDFPDNWKWWISPNPNDGHFVVEWDFPGQQETHLNILDLRGRILMERTLEGSTGRHEFSADLPPGMYLLQLSAGDRGEVIRVLIE